MQSWRLYAMCYPQYATIASFLLTIHVYINEVNVRKTFDVSLYSIPHYLHTVILCISMNNINAFPKENEKNSTSSCHTKPLVKR